MNTHTATAEKEPWYIALSKAPALAPLTIDVSKLTDEQCMIVSFRAQGITVREAAKRMNVSKDRVAGQCKEIADITGLRDLVSLTRGAIGAGLVELPSGKELKGLITGYEENLTPRMRQVMEMIAHNINHDDLAEMHGISPHTILDHVRSLYGVMDIHNTPQITRAWMALKQEADRIVTTETATPLPALNSSELKHDGIIGTAISRTHNAPFKPIGYDTCPEDFAEARSGGPRTSWSAHRQGGISLIRGG